MGNMSGSSGSHYTLWQSITQNSQNISNNTSNVTVRMYLTFDGSSWNAYTNYQTSGTMTINGTTNNYSIASINFTSGQAKDLLLAEWTGDIGHNSDGTKTLNVSGSWNTDTSRIGSGSCSASKILTTIPRYTTITSFTVSNITGEDGLTQVQYKWSASDSCDYAWYSIDGGVNYYALPINGKITGLTPGTTYKFRLKVRRTDSQLETQSSIVTTSTYDIAKISELNNFEHGANLTIKITNPAEISSLKLDMKIGNTQILSRTVLTGSNTIYFSDTELDNLYKTYGTKSSLTAAFILYGSEYTNSKTCSVSLKGNQKTIRTNVNNIWKRAKVWINVDGIWKRGIVWTNVSGTYRRCI